MPIEPTPIPPLALTILICTHNREELLAQVLASLNAAERPSCPVRLLVVANACTDGTVALLETYGRNAAEPGIGELDSSSRAATLPLTWLQEPRPGKSYALNTAIAHIHTELTAFVDDDHRVDRHYLTTIVDAAERWPNVGMYCGRILPDWNGSEPGWVHDEGPYRVYPLPVPRYDLGPISKHITLDEGPIPGGGNLVVRRSVFELAGQFSTELGPHGHDLGGGEDSEYVMRAMNLGTRCRYVPAIVQHHYVDVERLRFTYLLRKSFQRTRSTAQIYGNGRIPLYMWRKLFEYSLHILFSLSWTKTRFYCVRVAAVLGEIHGRHTSGSHYSRVENFGNAGRAFHLLLALTLLSGIVTFNSGGTLFAHMLGPVAGMALLGATGLTLKSLAAFSQTGPPIRAEILVHFRAYSAIALLRLTAWTFALMFLLGALGSAIYRCLALLFVWPVTLFSTASAAACAIVIGAILQFVSMMRHNPGLLIASMQYRLSRMYRLWEWGTAQRLRAINVSLILLLGALLVITSFSLLQNSHIRDLVSLWALAGLFCGLLRCAKWPEPVAALALRADKTPAKFNLLMIGSDTLRADRLGVLGYRRSLTPTIDLLAARSTLFENCHVPCARTAPSLVSMFTGTWPHTHGVRDNFVTDNQTRLGLPTLPVLLKPYGYYSATISDWCGADLAKFSMGFDFVDLPEDQWNLRYLIRQGPKDIRLFVSMYTHNRLGWALFPELYYLGGVPQTEQLGARSRSLLSSLALRAEPFLLNVFFSTTHPPFASEYPWYERYSEPGYSGESKFAMAKLTDPFEIIRRQGAPKEEFDLEQIIDLYDSCVSQFDSQVALMLDHVARCGLADNTIVVLYSDHGMEFFEHSSWGQGNSVIGDFSSRIPLIIHDPRSPGAIRVSASVRSVDLAPTLLELLGLPVPNKMEGVSLAPVVRGQQLAQDQDAFNETGFWLTEIPGLPATHLRYPELLGLIEIKDLETGTLSIRDSFLPDLVRAKDRMIRRGDWTLVYQPLTEGYELSLFNVRDDPNCIRNVLADHPELGQALARALLTWIRAEERVAEKSTCRDGCQPVSASMESAD